MKSLDWKTGDELVWEKTDVLGDEGDYLAAYLCKKVDWDRDVKPMLEKC